MKASLRLFIIAVMIVVSAMYGVLVTKSPAVASAAALWYCAAILTLFVLISVWRRP